MAINSAVKFVFAQCPTVGCLETETPMYLGLEASFSLTESAAKGE